MNAQTDQELLQDYAENRSDSAFAELVRRHIDLVYSAALRMVCDSHQAEDVTQSVFVALAQNARQLTHHPVLSGWLHRTTQNLAANAVRTNVRRQTREQEAVIMSELLSAEPDIVWENIAPHLDAALGELGDADHDALLLRYFERKSAREMAQILNTSEEAAQKRVNRAVERLREFFAERGITVGASGLVVLISANAVQAAPVGLAVSVCTAAVLGGAAVAAATTATATKAIAMTTLQKTLITATIAAAIGTGIYEARLASGLRQQVQSLQLQQQQQESMVGQIEQLQRERDNATNRLAALTAENATLKRNPTEVLKLRGEVGRLRQETASAGSNSALNKITANPETRKVLRDQQKLGMSMVYKGLAGRLKLAPEQTDLLNDLLAENVMDNVDLITTVLRDGQRGQEMDRIFSAQEAALVDKVQSLIGADGAAQFKDYTQNLASYLTAEQFKGMLTGEGAVREEKAKQLYLALQQETQSARAEAGLPPDYQLIPMLNFRNIASETEGELSLKRLEDIYAKAATRASAFLSPEELEKFKEFRATALNATRSALTVNRTLMAPISK